VFSARSGWDRTRNAFTERIERARAEGRSLIDLTASNPTDVGLAMPWAPVASALSDPRGGRYQPEPMGLAGAREAVAAHCGARGASVDPSQVVLTASTSEAYSFLFKLLADPGDALWVPRPSYPLIDVLAELEPLALRPYRLGYDGTWFIDFDSFVGPRPRAALVISPHNPTGHTVDPAEREKLAALGVPLIVDEVFADYVPGHRTFAGFDGALTFTLSGLSKVAGLPQLKLGWMVVSGPRAARDEALARLELIADAHLSAAAPVQLGLGALLELARDRRAHIQARLDANRAALAAARPRHATWDVLRSPGGWSAVIQVPRARAQDAWCQALLDAGVIVSPGYLFDIEAPHALVVSLLPPPEAFAAGAARLAQVLG